MASRRNYRSFLDIYALIGTTYGGGLAAEVSDPGKAMSAEGPTPYPEMPQRGSRVVKSS
jgi:hypothetical protein